MLAAFNSLILVVLEGLGQLGLLTRDVFAAFLRARVPGREFLVQLQFIGVKSLPVVLITGAFTGMVLCAQTYFQFRKVHMDTATMAVVAVSMCTELGPVLTGLMVAGRVGAALAAELGTMRVTEQIDALRTMATHPTDYLVVPRVLATALAMPVLTGAAVALGITAGLLASTYLLGIDPTYNFANMKVYTVVNHVLQGQVKAVVYGLIIALISCYKGLTCAQGAEGVGRATTHAVVYSSITILISNFFLTMALSRLLPTS